MTATYDNKKTRALKAKRERYVKGEMTAPEGAKWFYENQIAIIDMDIRDAGRAEAKRLTRLNLKRIEKKLGEIEELRKQVANVLLDDDVLGYSEMRAFREEVEDNFNLSLLVYGRNY